MVNLSKKVHGRSAMHLRFLCFSDKPLAAFGASDVDLAPASGYADGLLTPGAAEIPMFFVLQVVEKVQKCRVLTPSGLQIAGVHTEDAPEQRHIGQQTEKRQLLSQKRAQYHQHYAGNEQRHIQFVGAVAAQHEIAEPIANSSEHGKNHLFVKCLRLLYRQFFRKQPLKPIVHKSFTVFPPGEQWWEDGAGSTGECRPGHGKRPGSCAPFGTGLRHPLGRTVGPLPAVRL